VIEVLPILERKLCKDHKKKRKEGKEDIEEMSL
jgi:hypothetical protein